MLLRCLKTQNGKKKVSYREIAEQFDLKNRQDTNNYWREFQDCEEDLLLYLQRKQKLQAAFPLIEEQVLATPLLEIKEHYRIFCHENPEYRMCEPTFKEYYGKIDAVKLTNRIKEMIVKGEISADSKRMLK